MIFKGLLVFLIMFIMACSSSKKSNSRFTMSISQVDSLIGLEAVAKNDCFTCHKYSEKVIGPSFLSVANKYDQTMESIIKLAKKIQEGGNGSWGKLPMTPHLNLSSEDAQQMVKYIFSLKNR
jgi:cytochrome c